MSRPKNFFHAATTARPTLWSAADRTWLTTSLTRNSRSERSSWAAASGWVPATVFTTSAGVRIALPWLPSAASARCATPSACAVCCSRRNSAAFRKR